MVFVGWWESNPVPGTDMWWYVYPPRSPRAPASPPSPAWSCSCSSRRCWSLAPGTGWGPAHTNKQTFIKQYRSRARHAAIHTLKYILKHKTHHFTHIKTVYLTPHTRLKYSYISVLCENLLKSLTECKIYFFLRFFAPFRIHFENICYNVRTILVEKDSENL